METTLEQALKERNRLARRIDCLGGELEWQQVPRKMAELVALIRRRMELRVAIARASLPVLPVFAAMEEDKDMIHFLAKIPFPRDSRKNDSGGKAFLDEYDVFRERERCQSHLDSLDERLWQFNETRRLDIAPP